MFYDLSDIISFLEIDLNSLNPFTVYVKNEIYDIYYKGVYIQTSNKFGMIQFFKGWLFANNLIDL